MSGVTSDLLVAVDYQYSTVSRCDERCVTVTVWSRLEVPSDAFDPSRPNLERVLTWNNEVGDMRRCGSAAGCASAPRGCPGTHLALHLTKEILGLFVQQWELQKKKPAVGGDDGREL